MEPISRAEGLTKHYGDVKALVDLVGPGVAKQILFTGRRYPADVALRMGLIEEVVAPDDDTSQLELVEAGMIDAPETIESVAKCLEPLIERRADRIVLGGLAQKPRFRLPPQVCAVQVPAGPRTGRRVEDGPTVG